MMMPMILSIRAHFDKITFTDDRSDCNINFDSVIHCLYGDLMSSGSRLRAIHDYAIKVF